MYGVRVKQYKSMPYSILCLSDCNILQYVEYGVSSKEKHNYALYNHNHKK